MATTKQYRLKGHGTFMPREGWIYKGLTALKSDNRVFLDKEHGADELGVGANMVSSIRYWLNALGLITENRREGCVFTELGNTICHYDPYLEDPVTLWFLHYELARNEIFATVWYLFFNELEAEEFTKYELNQMLLKLLVLYSGQSSENITRSSLESDVMVLLNMYTKERSREYDPEDKSVSPFATLGLVKKEGERFCKVVPSLDTLSKYVVLYGMQDMLQQSGGMYSVQMDSLLGRGGVGKMLQLNRATLYGMVEQLSADGMLELNRTAGLDMIYQGRKYKREEIAKRYYKQCYKGSA